MVDNIDTPFGSSSIFYKPSIAKDLGNVSSPEIDGAGTQKKEKGILVRFCSFETKATLDKFLSSPEPFQLTAGNLTIVCSFVVGDTNMRAINIRYSGDLGSYLAKLTMELKDVIDGYAAEISKRGEKYGLAVSRQGIEQALENSVPFSMEKIISREKISKHQQKLFEANLKLLNQLTGDDPDPQIKAAILVLCRIVIRTNVDVLEAYNQSPDVRYNSAYTKRKLTANDILHMARRLEALQHEVKKFQTGQFKNADEVIAFVNNNLLDQSAIGEATRFVINVPFQQLTYQRRKQLLLYFIDGRRLEFSGFFRSTVYEMTHDVDRVSAGDIVYNLISTASTADKLQLITDLNSQHKIFDLMADSYFGLFGWLCTEIGQVYYAALTNKDELLLQTISKGQFIFFDNSFLGNRNAEGFDPDEKKLSFEVTESAIYMLPQLEICKTFLDKHLANDAHTLLSSKKLLSPLEMVVIIPVADMHFSFIDMQKGGMYMMPACMAYAIFREDTQAAIQTFVNLTIQVALCFIGVGAITAAIRAGSALGVFAGVADITLGALGATVNTIPEIQRNHPDFVKFVNYATLIYGLGRLGYSVYRQIKIAKLSRQEERAALLDAASEEEREIILLSTIGGKPIDPKLLKKIITAFEKQGGEIRMGTEESRALMAMKNAEGCCLDKDLIYLREDACTSAVYEELIHSSQHRLGKYNLWTEQYGSNIIAEYLMEREACEKLLRNARAWKIPEEEVAQITERLAIFNKWLKAKGI